MSLHSRTDYTKGALDESAVADGPWALLEQWVKEAVDAGISDPTAFTLNTLDEEGFPHGRIVLLRDTRDGQLVFYTNYRSEKGQDVERLGKAGATFFWPHAERQIRVRGTVTRVPASESDAYFASRPRGSQLGAWSSQQSTEATRHDPNGTTIRRHVALKPSSANPARCPQKGARSAAQPQRQSRWMWSFGAIWVWR